MEAVWCVFTEHEKKQTHSHRCLQHILTIPNMHWHGHHNDTLRHSSYCGELPSLLLSTHSPCNSVKYVRFGQILYCNSFHLVVIIVVVGSFNLIYIKVSFDISANLITCLSFEFLFSLHFLFAAMRLKVYRTRLLSLRDILFILKRILFCSGPLGWHISVLSYFLSLFFKYWVYTYRHI